MALAITSFLPTTGPTTGGTKVTITGTGLDTATAVLVGDVEGRIDTTATNTATSLTFIVPAIPNDSATLAYKVTVLDSATPTEAQSSTSFTYTTVSAPVLTPSLASKFKAQVKDGTGTYIDIRGVTNLQPAIAQTTQDDSDYESVVDGIQWGSDFVTGLKWSLVIKLDRKTAAGYVEDPGQKILRLASVQGGSDALVDMQWFDRNGGSEAYQGTGIVQWSDDGGDGTALSTVSVTIMGRGPRLTIANPA